MNEKTEAASSTGLLAAPIAPGQRRRWRPEELRGADLRGQDLRHVEGLLPEHLAGAVLTGATLPDDFAKFEALGQVAAISSEARKIFIGLLAACVYSWLVIFTTTDVALILNTASSPLPIINTPIPIANFYVVGAAVLAAVYCWLHMYLHHLWHTLATLPAVFPDGTPLDDKSDPWLLSHFVRAYSKRLSSKSHPLTRLEIPLSILLTWCLMPLTLVALWGRYLPRHGWFGTFLLGVLTGLTVFFGWHTFRFARATLRGEAPPPIWLGLGQSWREFRAQGWLGRIFMLLVALTPAALLVCSVGTFWVNPRQPDSWAAKGLNALSFVGIRTYADLREANVAERPDGWDGNDWSKVKRVDLRGRNLAFADATGTFLANADLRRANLKGAILRSAQLQGYLHGVGDREFSIKDSRRAWPLTRTATGISSVLPRDGMAISGTPNCRVRICRPPSLKVPISVMPNFRKPASNMRGSGVLVS